ncbi:hypothetical protein [Micromonospora sp. NPDC047074]|uniref:hypothetical protein n=1 Tax=Micromonospora sp. NPDC047074 TaxID=3154339 RepID=UPI0033F49265
MKEKLGMQTTSASLFPEVDRLDWSDLDGTASRCEAMLREIAADRELMTALVYGAPADPVLWSKCEEDTVEDKIVLCDDPERQFRLRLRLSKQYQEELAHQHRFSFSTLVLRGRYLHRTYRVSGDFGAGTSLDDVVPVWIHEDGPGDVFTIHHEAVHSTPLVEAGTVSLILRGPAEKERAPVLFREDRASELSADEQAEALAGAVPGEFEPLEASAGTFFWRVGEQGESATRRSKRQMRREVFDHWCRELIAMGVIEDRLS